MKSLLALCLIIAACQSPRYIVLTPAQHATAIQDATRHDLEQDPVWKSLMEGLRK